MSYLADRHLLVADPFEHGDSAPQLGLMMNLVRGFEFPWRAGGVALLRREMYPDVAVWTFCGVAVDSETQIVTFPGMTHLADQGYQYAVVAFLGNGMASAMVEPLRLDFDNGGNLISPRLPNFPVDLTVKAIDGGKFVVSWTYTAWGQGGPPTDFQVFEGVDAASVNYGAALVDSLTGLNVVAAGYGTRVYTLTTAAFAGLSGHVFGVRARSSAGTAEKNVYVTESIVAQAAAPQAVGVPQTVHVRSYSPAGGAIHAA